ncbi:MAG: hypothetical protein AVDCRST_MAG36-584 [uncultured Nocardioidaceae bacterium]|uniref:Peptidase S9 prolyl oligopeptidase catalytic domain-containing protein n=1 Tax=uncultured Nocardioidaceae bacterium TaxID=253824 RepID=A0A6J4L5W1_9ACTN|nr:MAG: hypothetical protein AVDCRST_MAG36-584 [uncultured Nocardioidaceae bacterium]
MVDMRRLLTRIVLAALLVVLVVYGAGGSYFASRINSGALAVQHPPDKTVDVVEVTGGEITVREKGEDLRGLEADMIYGLAWDGGHGEVHGPPRATSGSDPDRTQVTRSFRVSDGDPPAAGDVARVDRDVYPPEADLGEVLGTTVDDVEYTSPAGRFGAWYVPGRGGTWAVFTHGALGSDRSEALRAMQATVALGMPSLAITYRNDIDVPGDESGRYRYGRTEWRDLEGAVRYALDHGAQEVTLVGYSMGGAITAAFLQHSELAASVTRVVLDSPMLDLRRSVRHGAEQLQLPVVGAPPTSLVRVAERVAAARYDLDWDAVDYLDDPSWVSVPTLVFHGTDDLRAPLAATEQLRDTRPGLVTLVVVDGAGHIEAWNSDPQGYQRELTAFLTDS